jgi:epoxyqueuosine reductase
MPGETTTTTCSGLGATTSPPGSRTGPAVGRGPWSIRRRWPSATTGCSPASAGSARTRCSSTRGPEVTSSPLEVDHCGTCTACLDACPTGALPEPRLLDARRCISAITIEDRGPVPAPLREQLADWIFGCDICQEVCPWNRHAPGSDEPAFQPRETEPTLPLADLLALDDGAFRDRFAGSPILRAKRRGLLRSAALALGNRPDPNALAALSAALADAEPVIRGAAAWALGRWVRAGVRPAEARAAVAARLAVETDADVRGELGAALGAG